MFKVAGKMFALSRLDAEPLQVSLKCEPELAESLRLTYDAVQPGYHLNKRHWNTVTIDGSLEDRMVFDMLEDSYDLVVDGLPKARRPGLAVTRSARPPPSPRTAAPGRRASTGTARGPSAGPHGGTGAPRRR